MAKTEDDSNLDRAPGTSHAGPAPAVAPTPAGPVPALARRGAGFLGPVAGGVAAAAIGYGAALVTGPGGLSFGRGSDGPDAAILTALRDSQDRLAAIETRLASLPTAESLATAAARGMQDDLAALSERATAMSDQIGGLADQVTALSGQVISFDGRLTEALTSTLEMAESATAKALAASEADIAALRAENAELSDSMSQATQAAEAEVGAARERAAEVEARAALVRIEAALASGDAFDMALGQLGTVEIPGPLAAVAASGVATLSELQRDFPPAARAALAAALELEAGGDGDVGDRVDAFVRSQLGIRSLEPRAGVDVDAILSRAEAALRTGDLRAALAELETLPEAARPPLSGWIDAAAARADALDAVRQLGQGLNTN